MANALYPKGKEAFLDGDITWLWYDMKCCLVRGYTYNGAHKFLNEVTATGTVVARSDLLENKSVTNGVCKADNLTFPVVPAGAAIESLIMYSPSWDDDDSFARLIAYIDTAGGTLPITPDDDDISVTWDATGIFSL